MLALDQTKQLTHTGDTMTTALRTYHEGTKVWHGVFHGENWKVGLAKIGQYSEYINALSHFSKITNS